GFKLNQEETCDKNNVTNYIINYQVEQNVHSDHQFALETLERHGNNSETKVIIADGAYGSEMTLTVT
ncbi:MAG: hypothetical protein LBF12_03615, partial [Christensenellaceae bacterium]|nr:hypothetical protein [Christensenellaceae bacterium]